MNKLTTQSIKISVLIATRNRPNEFLTALNSVLAQSYLNIEVIVVNDGSDEEHLTHYQVIEDNNKSRVKFIYLAKRPNGHGPSFARNTAAQHASGDFLAFLDDDDLWTDPEHLTRFVDVLHVVEQLELYFTNQIAVKSDGSKITKPLWLDSLQGSVSDQSSVSASAVRASAEWLLSTSGFAHLNCTIVSRQLFNKVSGFDESLRYEEDKDLYWRLVDNSKNIFFDRHYVALHNVPDKSSGASNYFNDLKKKQTQLWIAEKNFLLASKSPISKACESSMIYTCKHISQILIKQRKYSEAKYYIKKALAVRFNIKWWLFLSYFRVINLFR